MSERNSEYGYQAEAPQIGAMAQVSVAALAVKWVGASVSIGLVAGLAYWGYQLSVRDVSEVPVVRAMAGPLRVQPDEPGGEAAPHQGLAVNQVQSEGGVSGPASQVLLAPPPVSLTTQDISLAKIRPQPRTPGLDTEALKPVLSLELNQGAGRVPALELSNTDVAAIQDTSASAERLTAAQLADLPGVKRSPRPKARPGGRALVAKTVKPVQGQQVALATAPGAAVTVDADPSTVVPGSRLVQLGAFDDRAAASKEWQRILKRHGDLIGSRQRLIQKAESGGRYFYRLRVVGFTDISDSRRLCSALLARGTPCIPVTAR